jgi:hypothetical protein
MTKRSANTAKQKHASQIQDEGEIVLTAKQVSVVRDPTYDGPDTEYVGSPLDSQAPIDFDVLSATIRRLGPFRARSSSNPYTVELAIYDCSCGKEGCSDEVAIVRRRNGLFSIQWMLTREEVERFDSLDHLRYAALAGHMDDTCAERQEIEHAVEANLGKHYREVEAITCLCDSCAAEIGKERLPLIMLLSQMASSLSTRVKLLEEVREIFKAREAPANALDEIEDYVSFGFDLGYQLGRQYSEYQVKKDIEGDALIGKSFEQLKAKRAHNAGVASSGKRLERMTALVEFMERLAASNPAMLRTGPLALATLACEDATSDNPGLWSQGAGQIEEYLGMIGRGEAGDELKARYFAMFPAKHRPTREPLNGFRPRRRIV